MPRDNSGIMGADPREVPGTPEYNALHNQDEMRRRAGEAYGRQTFTSNYDQTDRALGDFRRAYGYGQEAVDMADKAAAGDPNSVAQQQLQRGIQQGQQNATTAASMARGGALAQAATRRAAINAGSSMAAQGVGASASLQANEMAAGRQDLANLTAQQRALGQRYQSDAAGWAVDNRRLQAIQEEQNRRFGRELGQAESGFYGDEIGRQGGLDRLDVAEKQRAAANRKAHQDEERAAAGAVTSAGGAVLVPAVAPPKSSDERGKRPGSLAEAATKRRRMQ